MIWFIVVCIVVVGVTILMEITHDQGPDTFADFTGRHEWYDRVCKKREKV